MNQHHLTGQGDEAMSPRRPRSLHLVAVALVGLLLFVAACGEDDKKQGGGGPATQAEGAKKPTGEPIVAYTFADVNTQGPQYKNIHESARIYGEYINAQGGIKGRPLEVKLCDMKGTPTDATACARKAVADKAIAVVGSFSFTGDAVVPVLEKGDTAYWGLCCPLSPAELTNKTSFPMGNSPLYGVGLVKRAAEDGCQKISAVLIQGAEAFRPILDAAAKEYGTKIDKYVSMPGTARDYSPQVAAATGGGTDCVIMIVSETPFIAWMSAFAQSGSEARQYGPQGNLNEKVAKGFEEVTDGDVVAGMYPDMSLPQWKDYREALEKYGAAEGEDYNSLGGLGTWAAYEGFRQVVEGISGEITPKTFLDAASTAKIDLPGMVPPLDFTKTWDGEGGPKGFDRLEHRCVVFSKLEGGKLKPLTTEFEDVAVGGGGKTPSVCG